MLASAKCPTFLVGRAVALFLLSLLLHAWLLRTVWHTVRHAPIRHSPPVVVELLKPQPVAPPAPKRSPHPTPHPAHRPASKQTTPPEPHTPDRIDPQILAHALATVGARFPKPEPTLAAVAPPALASTHSTASGSGASASGEAGKGTGARLAPLDAHAGFDLPPSATLHYLVEAQRGPQLLYGSGKIAWRHDGQHYSVAGDAAVLFFSLLDFSSRGDLGEYGLSPSLYTEKKFRKSETNTHFQNGKISFSASTAHFDEEKGAQDRASLVWQLAGMLRADPKKWKKGVALEVQVAGVKDAETWTLIVEGLEKIALRNEDIEAIHLSRTPHPESYDQALDLWFAPSRNYYPVELLFTHPDGDYVKLTSTYIFKSDAPPLGTGS